MAAHYFYPYRREPAYISPPSIARAIAVRPKLLLLITAAVFCLFTVLILGLPKGYVSQMKLRVGPEGEIHDSSMASAQLLATKPAENLDNRIGLDIDVLQSRDMLSQVVMRLGLQKLEESEDGHFEETSAWTIDKAVQRLKDGLIIEREKNTNVLDVSDSALRPEIAAAILQNLANLYPRARLTLYGDSGRQNFLHRQSASWREQLNEAESDLVRFRRRYSGFVLPEERAALGRRAIEAQAAFEQADAQVAQFSKKVAEAQARLKQIDPAFSDRVKSGLKRDSVAHATRTPAQAGNGNNVGIAPVQQNAEINLITSETELAGLEALRNHLRHTADEYKQEMFQLADAEVRDDSLLRQVKRTEEQYLLYSKWQEESRAAEALAGQSVANFGVIQSPTVPLEASSPHLFIDLTLAFLLSVCCGLATVLWAEYLTPTALRNYANLRRLPAMFEVLEATE